MSLDVWRGRRAGSSGAPCGAVLEIADAAADVFGQLAASWLRRARGRAPSSPTTPIWHSQVRPAPRSRSVKSELFGHERGVFTGAIARRPGCVEFANKGTLILHEVGDIPLELQAQLLRVLQEQEFKRLGSNRTYVVYVRLIAANTLRVG